MRVCFVVQRYGLEINGGAELHCRWIAEHMSLHHEVEVLTTRAFDYVTWKNRYPRGTTTVNGVPVRRFSVTRPRRPDRFGRIQSFILECEHREADELRWLDEEGPRSPALLRYVRRNRANFDYFFFFSYRYYHSFHGIRAVPGKSILVPTAERDPIIHLRIFRDIFNLPRAIIYNSPEERAMINLVARNEGVPGDVVGVGSVIPPESSAARFRARHGLDGGYILYIGRIDENKGFPGLFDHFLRFKAETGAAVKLVLIGSTIMNIPSHPDIRHLGFLEEQDKFDALDGALALMMPSYYESLSMVTLEAWALGKPVLANARCEVLRGQCLRSNAGLFYEGYSEFKEALALVLESDGLRRALGENGRKYFLANYTWDRITAKYQALLDRLEKDVRV